MRVRRSIIFAAAAIILFVNVANLMHWQLQRESDKPEISTITATQTQPTTIKPVPTPTHPSPEWLRVASFSGVWVKGMCSCEGICAWEGCDKSYFGDTAYFKITSREWRIRWWYKPVAGYPPSNLPFQSQIEFGFAIYDRNGRLMDTVGRFAKPSYESGVLNYANGPGEWSFHWVNIWVQWEIIVEQRDG